MKFKRVLESGIVTAFALVMTVSSVYGTNVTVQSPDSQEVELSAEPAGVGNGSEKATREKVVKQVVAAAMAENEPEQTAENTEEISSQEKAAGPEETAEEPEQAAAPAETAEEPEQAAAPAEVNTEETATPEETEEAKGAEETQESVEEPQESPEEPQESPEETQESVEETQKLQESAEETEAPVVDSLVAMGSEEVSPWASKLLPNVEDYLNIRTEPSDEAELAGKLHKGASADILEKGDEWTKISSGSVEGYVKNEFCVVGLEAERLANEVGTVYATATTGGVRVREEASASEETEILDVLEEGGKVKVDTDMEAAEGWVAVKMEEGTGYISAEYVDVELKLGKAISIEEERAAIAAAEAEKARKAAQQAGGSVSQRGAVSASYDDVTLLGALIQCEAGSEPYEGKLAVGAVVMNRLRAGYAGSISGVIYQSGQFTPASSGSLASVLASGVSGSCLQAAQEAIGGASNVGGATSFRSVSSGMSGIVIGNHVFF